MFKKLLVPTMAAAIVLTGCSTGDMSKLQSDVEALQKEVAELKAQLGIRGNAVNGSTEPGGASAVTKEYYALGEEVIVGGVTYKITEGERNTKIGNNITAKSGNEFVFYNVDLLNTGESDYLYSQSHFSIVTGSGEIVRSYLVIDVKNEHNNLGDGTLAQNGKRSGWIVFQLPQGDQPSELRYEKSERSVKNTFKVKLK